MRYRSAVLSSVILFRSHGHRPAGAILRPPEAQSDAPVANLTQIGRRRAPWEAARREGGFPWTGRRAFDDRAGALAADMRSCARGPGLGAGRLCGREHRTRPFPCGWAVAGGRRGGRLRVRGGAAIRPGDDSGPLQGRRRPRPGCADCGDLPPRRDAHRYEDDLGGRGAGVEAVRVLDPRGGPGRGSNGAQLRALREDFGKGLVRRAGGLAGGEAVPGGRPGQTAAAGRGAG